MKLNNLFLFGMFPILFTSCMTASFYQVYKAVPSEELTLKENAIVYEDENCKISYNLWRENGNIGFQFYNRTENNIYLNLEECFFILNGVSYNYFKNRIYSESSMSGITSSRGVDFSKSVSGINYSNLTQTNKSSIYNINGVTTTNGLSVSYYEEKVICIPSKTSKIIMEYNVNSSFIHNCELYRFPTKKGIQTKTFTKNDSPLTFGNRIAYSLGKNEKQITIENEFYVSEICNYPESEMFDRIYEEYCEQKSPFSTTVFKNAAPDKFYITYKKDNDIRIH